MKLAFAVIGLVLVLLSIYAYKSLPDPNPPGKTRLVWVTDNNPVRAEQVALFNRLNPDLELVIDPANTDQQKVIVQSIGGVGPDLFDTYGRESAEAYVASGIAWDITDEMLKAGIDVPKIIWPVAVPSCVVNGRVYGFPCNVNANAIWFNKDVFDRAGVPYPKPGWTWDEFIETAKKLTIRDERGRAKQFGLYWDWNATRDLIYQHGGRYFNETATVCTLDTPEAIAGMRLSHDLMYRHRIAPTPNEEAALSTQGGWGSGGITFLMSGRVAMAYGGRWWLNLMRKQKGLRLGVVEIPYAKERVTVGGARCTFVNKNSPNREKALRFIKFLASREYNELLNDQADALAPVMEHCYTCLLYTSPSPR
ncbi:MAG: sugar ABC transporter substrate-binding protein, partial [Fimbriimonadales bacterium]|nr:sugar ABC transporter substrate-binding protein [Fimbriimonadales bacterium]